MPMTFSKFLVQLAETVQEENGPHLAYLLNPTNPHGVEIVREFRNPTKQNLKHYEGSLESPWDEIAIQYVLVVWYGGNRRAQDAFREYSALISAFFRFFTNNSGWTLPALFSLLQVLRDVAFDADMEDPDRGNYSMEEAARIISKAFSNCVTDRVSPLSESRKWGVYYVVGLVLKTYFRIHRTNLAKPILRALAANTDIPPVTSYPRSHQVTYRYYVGMLHFLNEEYAQAEQELTFAFYHCHENAKRNQERILAYLIPLRILKGNLPSSVLLDRYPTLTKLYTPFITAIRRASLKEFDQALEVWETTLVELNLYLTIEKARELCLRGLFKRVWLAADKSSRIPIAMFHSSLTLSGVQVSQEETECLVANMIYKGYMRGYISHEQQMVVLARQNTYPSLVDRPQAFAL